jgi:hypothetical protein
MMNPQRAHRYGVSVRFDADCVVSHEMGQAERQLTHCFNLKSARIDWITREMAGKHRVVVAQDKLAFDAPLRQIQKINRIDE